MYREMQDLMEESGAYRFLTPEVNAIMYRDFVNPAVRPDGIALYNHFRKACGRQTGAGTMWLYLVSRMVLAIAIVARAVTLLFPQQKQTRIGKAGDDRCRN